MAIRLLPLSGDEEQGCCEHSCTSICATGYLGIVFEKTSIQSLAYFKIGPFALLLLSSRCSLYIVDTRSLSDIFFLSSSPIQEKVRYLLTVFAVSFDAQSF